VGRWGQERRFFAPDLLLGDGEEVGRIEAPALGLAALTAIFGDRDGAEVIGERQGEGALARRLTAEERDALHKGRINFRSQPGALGVHVDTDLRRGNGQRGALGDRVGRGLGDLADARSAGTPTTSS
jgi:hypothetical protein